MDRLTKARKVTRTSITKTTNKINEELNKDIPDHVVLRVLRDDISRLKTTVELQDQGVFNNMLDEDRSEEELNTENDETTVYREKLSLAMILIDDCLTVVNGDNSSVHTVITPHSNNDNVNDNGQTRKLYKLPKIEISKFDGELLNWLSFWSQFEKIHSDKQLHDADKFQYLSQSMQENSRAKELVKGYPQTADNYPKVITALTERFGKKKILKQVYVRELIKMVITNVNAKQKISISKLFDNLESHLRALESLTVTVEQMSEFLYPLVESSLPEETLIAWQRSGNFGKDGTAENPVKTELDYLMLFLKQEVESEQQRNLARTGFSTIINKSNENTSINKFHSKEKPKIPTATNLFVSNSNSCIFCGKNHQSQDCNKALEMSLKAKEELLKEKKACNRCLKIHNNQRCKAWVKCTGCTKQHFHIMCPERVNQIAQTVQNAKATNNIVANQVHLTEVLLKTIFVKITTDFESKIVRVLFDDGSQRSYIRSAVAIELKLTECNKYFERNTLFGNIISNIEERTVYRVPITSLDKNQAHILELPDKDQITGDILKLPKGPWLKELKSKKIWINDYSSKSEEIDILIGADLIPLLTTDESITLDCGLKAVKTVFGWTIMGPLPKSSINVAMSQSMIATQSQIDSNNIKNLWDLEVIGIQDPIEVQTKAEKNLKAMEHFITTVKRNNDGRYKVSLPWVDGCQKIPDNFLIAEKRLLNSTKKLKETNMFDTYGGLFKEWEKENFIEEIELSQNLSSYHFIPHHPVFKPESKTTPVRPVFDASCKVGRNPSLNECLEKGPNLLELIPTVMLYFREEKIGVLADIRKAFQMIEIEEQDQHYVLFLWWEDDTCARIKIFKHKRVVFGLKSSPFILAAVINHHLDHVKNKSALTEKFKKCLYVDNEVTSVKSMTEYEQFKTI